LEIDFSITPQEVRGPFNLSDTMQSGQTSEPYWFRIDDAYWDAYLDKERLVKYEVHSSPDVEKPSLSVRLSGSGIDESTVRFFRTYLIELFRLQDDLPSFYLKFRSEKIAQAFKEFSGLRLMKASDPYESLICSICSQHSSVEQWNKMVRCIKAFFGKRFNVRGGLTFYSFPSPETLAEASSARLESCQTGYRADYIIRVSKKIVDGGLDLEDLKHTSYEKAKNELMELPGIGPKVADCFLLYGLGQTRAAPVDVWIHRIVSKVYFGGAKMTKDEVGKFLRKRYGEWAGLAQIYLYHYGRMRFRSLFPAERRLL